MIVRNEILYWKFNSIGNYVKLLKIIFWGAFVALVDPKEQEICFKKAAIKIIKCSISSCYLMRVIYNVSKNTFCKVSESIVTNHKIAISDP